MRGRAGGVDVLVSAGEPSGDMHAAEVVRALRRRAPGLTVAGLAGPAMRAAGCRAWVTQEQLAVMGLVEVVRHLPRIHAVGRLLLERAAACRPKAAVLVDFSSFHIRLGARLRALGIPVVHYIAPKLWAWGAWRVRRLARSQDLLAAIFPFEEEWFARHGIRARYVGNPVASRADGGWSRAELCRRLGLDRARRVLALLPGSRPSELDRHLPLLATVMARLRAEDPALQVVVPQAPGLSSAALAPLRAQGGVVVPRLQPEFALRVDAAVAVSGTATLELALWGTPTVLVYRAAPTTIWLARRLVGLNCVGLANILLDDQEIMPELIQEQATPDRVVACVRPLLAGGEAAARQRWHFARLRDTMGSDDPAQRVADAVISLGGVDVGSAR
ncbi:MAG: lipid-A-disaccharide synthase [Zetaproteobacteria bacterium]|nr:MAG: lipid-A-disaccharide synthase [Zetaproteobacteria bacterium]